MVAAAAYAEPERWCDFVGEWITELAFEDMTSEEARGFSYHVGILLVI